MEGLNIILPQIAMLSAVIFIGFIAVKLKYLKPEVRGALSQVIIKITLPCLIFTSITGRQLEKTMIVNAGIVAILTAVTITVLLFFGFLSAKVFRLKNATKTIHICMSSFGNVIFLGYPLITALYGQDGLFYAIIYAMVNDGFVWTLSIYMMCKDSGMSAKKSFLKLINPNTVTFAISLLMLFFGLRLPNILHTTISKVGELTTYSSMIFIGMTLAVIDLSSIYKRVSVYALCLVKMVAVPLVLIFLFRYLSIDKTVLGVIIIEAAVPVQTVLTILANEYKSDFKYAAECVFISTVVSIFTLPLIYYLIINYI